MSSTSGAKATERFFEELDSAIIETPQEKEERVKTTRAVNHDLLQEKLRQLKQMVGKTLEVPMELIHLSENIRANINQESPEFRALVDSIRDVGGVLQAPVVAVLERDGALRLVCLAGHRRLLALKASGAKRASVRMLDIKSEKQHLTAALAENVLREDLHPLDIAKTLSRLKQLGLSGFELGKATGKNAKTVGHFVKMQDDWPEEARDLIRSHPEKFNTRSLLILAKRNLTDEEVLTKLRAQISGRKVEAKVRQPAKKAQILAYCQEKMLNPRDQEMIIMAFESLGFI